MTDIANKTETAPPLTEEESGIIRTPYSGCYEVVHNPYWGTYAKQIDDPKANAPDNLADEFEVVENFPKVPAEIWSAFTDLFFHYVKAKCTLEVHCVLLRDNVTGRNWKAVVPKQEVTGASVESNLNECVDLLDGEKSTYSDLLDNWDYAGSIHTHPMGNSSWWSSTDDKDELGKPGLHAICTSPNVKKMEYIPIASIVQNKTRFKLPVGELIEFPDYKTKKYPTFHQNVLTQVTIEKPKWNFAKGIKANSKVVTKSASTGKTVNNSWNDHDIFLGYEYDFTEDGVQSSLKPDDLRSTREVQELETAMKAVMNLPGGEKVLEEMFDEVYWGVFS